MCLRSDLIAVALLSDAIRSDVVTAGQIYVVC